MARPPLSPEQAESLMRLALEEARLGLSEGETPIGCVLAVLEPAGPRVVARGHNRVRALARMSAHAEMVAFENAGAHPPEPAVLDTAAQEVLLVSTLEPCVMCFGACLETGVRHVLFGLEAPADSGTRRVKPPQSPETAIPTLEGGVLAEESRALFEQWLAAPPHPESIPFVKQLLRLTASRENGDRPLFPKEK